MLINPVRPGLSQTCGRADLILSGLVILAIPWFTHTHTHTHTHIHQNKDKTQEISNHRVGGVADSHVVVPQAVSADPSRPETSGQELTLTVPVGVGPLTSTEVQGWVRHADPDACSPQGGDADSHIVVLRVVMPTLML
ncbi:hypothetical protein AVEN_42233-1 [Araneus ventricosus]|uniref:Uncharacterized protein n=1 Tax=Araneus ventricosus TaxID=182803 RepID=A0A4Y2B1N7_ARAVE|nr:hypothetical protein AVEN_42233-1 [Araneus ventricosus]